MDSKAKKILIAGIAITGLILGLWILWSSRVNAPSSDSQVINISKSLKQEKSEVESQNALPPSTGNVSKLNDDLGTAALSEDEILSGENNDAESADIGEDIISDFSQSYDENEF